MLWRGVGKQLLHAQRQACRFPEAVRVYVQARGRCRPSYGVVGRLDPTIHVGHEFANGTGRTVVTGVEEVSSGVDMV